MAETINKCPGCGRNCDLNAPNCPRGEAYARGETPETPGFDHTSHKRPERMDETDHRGSRCNDHGGEHAFAGYRHGHEGHGPKQPNLSPEQYDSLSTDEKLGIQLRELGHMGRLQLESKGGQGRILNILAREGNMTQRALTEKLGIQPGSASEVIGKLERAGFIERSENESDRRTSDIRLTDAGRAQTESESDEQPKLFSALSAEEQQQLLALLEKLTADWKVRFPRKGPGRDDFHGHKGDRRRENHSGNHR